MKNAIVLMAISATCSVNISAQTNDSANNSPTTTPSTANPMAPKWMSGSEMMGLPPLPGMPGIGVLPAMPNLGSADSRSFTAPISTTPVNTMPKLQGVLVSSNGQALAMIDGKTLEMGQQIRGWTVSSIQNDSVTLMRDGKPMRLRLFSGSSEVSGSMSGESVPSKPKSRVKKQYNTTSSGNTK